VGGQDETQIDPNTYSTSPQDCKHVYEIEFCILSWYAQSLDGRMVSSTAMSSQ